MFEKRTVYVAYTNTDLSEGRGYDVPIAVCLCEATATRLARHKYVQGSDGPVRSIEQQKIDGLWYTPELGVRAVDPTREDILAQTALDCKRAALDKAKMAGLTDADLRALNY